MKDEHCINYMSQPEPQRYFRQLVYYVISLIVAMNEQCQNKWCIRYGFTDSNYDDAYSLAQNICDEFYILHDLLQCQLDGVTACIENTILRSVLEHTCFPAVMSILDAQTASVLFFLFLDGSFPSHTKPPSSSSPCFSRSSHRYPLPLFCPPSHTLSHFPLHRVLPSPHPSSSLSLFRTLGIANHTNTQHNRHGGNGGFSRGTRCRA